jgi:predicted RNA-binding Zn ribbon-like protein
MMVGGRKEVSMKAESLLGLGGHAALDFLNSQANSARGTIELIADAAAYLSWLEAEGLIDGKARRKIESDFDQADLEAAARAAVSLRMRLRPAVEAWAAGEPDAPDASVLATVNEILQAGNLWQEVAWVEDKLAFRSHYAWRNWQALLAPIAEAVADLFVNGDRSLVRQCDDEVCPLWFYDHTKSHRRRWCSMAICGNRAKVRQHRARSADSSDKAAQG